MIPLDPSPLAVVRDWTRLLGRYDLAVDLHGTTRTALLSLSAPRRFGPAKGGQRVFYTDSLPAPAPGRHTLLRNLDLLSALGIPIPERTPAPVARILPPPEKIPKPYWGIHPGARFPHKIWPLDRFADLARGLDGRLVILEGPLDGAVAARLAELLPEARVVRGLSPARTAGLLAEARGFVGNDSGPAHLAATVGIPVLVLFGPSDDELWRPWGPRVRVLRAACVCGYGSAGPCREATPCLARVEVADAEAALRGLLG